MNFRAGICVTLFDLCFQKITLMSNRLHDSCDSVIYNKKCIFGLCSVAGTELLLSLEFPKR